MSMFRPGGLRGDLKQSAETLQRLWSFLTSKGLHCTELIGGLLALVVFLSKSRSRLTSDLYDDPEADSTLPSVTLRSVSTNSSHRSSPSRCLTSGNHEIASSTIA